MHSVKYRPTGYLMVDNAFKQVSAELPLSFHKKKWEHEASELQFPKDITIPLLEQNSATCNKIFLLYTPLL